MADPSRLRDVSEQAMQTLIALPAETPSLRLLADETAKVLAGLLHMLDGLALLLDTPGQTSPGVRVRLTEPDWLPALINAARAFLAIGAVELFWIVTAWPNGVSAIVFVAIIVLLLSPKGDLAYGGSLALALGTAGTVICAAIMKFAILPNLQTYPAYCAAVGLFYLPVGFAMALSQRPAVAAILMALAFNFNPLLAPTNQMDYNTAQFYNSALAIVVGCSVAPLAFLLLPPLSPAVRTRRLLAATSRDLHRLAIAPLVPTPDEWQSRVCSRLTALPEQAEPLRGAQLLAALSVGTEIISLRHMAAHLGKTAELDAALKDFAQGNSAASVAKLRQFDDRLALARESEAEADLALRARGRILLIREALAEHGQYFDAGAPA
jgi:uncharacterized membrane protein YccC